MSKKKSYMDRDNILTEAKFFDLFKIFKSKKSEPQKKSLWKVLKNRTISKKFIKFSKLHRELNDDLEKEAKRLGIKL